VSLKNFASSMTELVDFMDEAPGKLHSRLEKYALHARKDRNSAH